MVSIAKVTSKGQVTIPKELRDQLNIEQGSSVVFVRRDEGVMMVPLNPPNAAQPRPGRASREMTQQEKRAFIQEEASKYNIDLGQAREERKGKSAEQLLDETQEAFRGVAEESGWETEDDVVAYIKALRRGEQD